MLLLPVLFSPAENREEAEHHPEASSPLVLAEVDSAVVGTKEAWNDVQANDSAAALDTAAKAPAQLDAGLTSSTDRYNTRNLPVIRK